jgi:hypothetical protein
LGSKIIKILIGFGLACLFAKWADAVGWEFVVFAFSADVFVAA